ncbi:hypothetical protein B0H14DRAFT_2580000 [Mycena olivaceomarginata]|nr:hypothetical protein B0H14DRAFT_2580000 [Mycena olivaceomarginata]
MANRIAKKIQPAAKETVNNSATVLEGSQKIYVHMVASCPGTEAANVLGVVARHFPEAVSFNSTLEDLLLSEFIVPRFYRNFNPELDRSLGTLGEFYDLHNLLSNPQRAKCFALPSNMKLQPPYIYLEGRILVEEQKKRKSTFDSANIQAKKFRGTTTKVDIERLRRPAPHAIRATGWLPVALVAHRNLSNEAGVVNTTDPDLGDPGLTVEKCEIAKELVGKGMSQYAYKRFFNIGNGRNQVTLLENREELTKRRPTYIKWVGFWPLFMSVLRRPASTLMNISLLRGCQLVVEVTQQGEAPSKASGYSLSDARKRIMSYGLAD